MNRVYDRLVDITFARLLAVIRKHRDSPVMEKHISLLDERNESDREGCKYGLKALYMNAWKTIVLVILALQLEVHVQAGLFAIAYVSLRFFSHGLHLNSSMACTILGLTYYLGVSSLAAAVTIPHLLQITLWIACFALVLLYAPAATKKRPIFPREKTTKKLASLIVLAALATASGVLAVHGKPEIGSIFLADVICQTINILPVSYKILKQE